MHIFLELSVLISSLRRTGLFELRKTLNLPGGNITGPTVFRVVSVHL